MCPCPLYLVCIDISISYGLSVFNIAEVGYSQLHTMFWYKCGCSVITQLHKLHRNYFVTFTSTIYCNSGLCLASMTHLISLWYIWSRSMTLITNNTPPVIYNLNSIYAIQWNVAEVQKPQIHYCVSLFVSESYYKYMTKTIPLDYIYSY